MKLHGNARTCPHSRLLMVRRVELEDWTLAAAASAAGVSVRTVSKWLRCYRAQGVERSARPLLGAAFDPASHCRGAGAGDRRPATSALHRRRDRATDGWLRPMRCLSEPSARATCPGTSGRMQRSAQNRHEVVTHAYRDRRYRDRRDTGVPLGAVGSGCGRCAGGRRRLAAEEREAVPPLTADRSRRARQSTSPADAVSRAVWISRGVSPRGRGGAR